MPDRRLEFQRRILRRVTGTTAADLVARQRLRHINADQLQRVVKRFRAGETLDETEQNILFSIISPELRPAIPVINDRPDHTDHPLWRDLNEQASQDTLEAACKATGRIEYSSGAEFKPYGSGFLVSEDLILTNRHVADVFTMPVPGFGHLKRFGYSARINFCRERDRWDSDPTSTKKVTEITMIHPWFDLALLRIEDGPDGVEPLALSVADAETALDNRIAIVGYPSMDPDENIDIQEDLISTFDRKHVSPGFVDAVEVKTFQGRTGRALGHDSSTLTGNSGSPVVNLQSGSVIGLHFKGNSDGLNWAVPSADIASDSRVIDAGVSFDGNAVARAGPWETAWAVS